MGKQVGVPYVATLFSAHLYHRSQHVATAPLNQTTEGMQDVQCTITTELISSRQEQHLLVWHSTWHVLMLAKACTIVDCSQRASSTGALGNSR